MSEQGTPIRVEFRCRDCGEVTADANIQHDSISCTCPKCQAGYYFTRLTSGKITQPSSPSTISPRILH